MTGLTLARDDRIDLQIHTVYSDGQWQPVELFAWLQHEAFRAVAITDHDTMEHLGELQVLGERHGVHVVPAVEVTANWHGRGAHLLCYAQRFTGDALAGLTRRTEAAQRANTAEVYEELLRRGHRFPRRPQALAHQQGQVVRPVDNATLLHAHGYAATLDEALAHIRDAGYRSITAPLSEAVDAAHASGAVAVLAHPGRGGGEIQAYPAPLVREVLAAVPLDGIEVRYPLHTDQQVAEYTALARERGLLISAGSDSHGPGGRLPIPYPAASSRALLERCGVSVR